MRGGRRETGALMALYEDLMRRGVSRGYVPGAIEEGVKRGLLAVEKPDVWPRPDALEAGTEPLPADLPVACLP